MKLTGLAAARSWQLMFPEGLGSYRVMIGFIFRPAPLYKSRCHYEAWCLLLGEMDGKNSTYGPCALCWFLFDCVLTDSLVGDPLRSNSIVLQQESYLLSTRPPIYPSNRISHLPLRRGAGVS